MGRIALFIFFLCSIAPFCFAKDTPYEELFEFKQGVLEESETWSGKILLLGDVLIPEGVELTISPDSWIIYNEIDLGNLGSDAVKPEIVVNGKLNIPDNSNVKLVALGDSDVQKYIEDNSAIEAVAIKPKPEPLADLERDLHTSKRAYAWLWVAIYSIWLVL